MLLLYFDKTGGKAYDLGYSIGYFIAENLLFLLLGILIFAGLFVIFLRKKIRNNKRQIEN
ncbi:LPXTG cell wall anchor domain-containing protein [Salegentibacter salegens]|uniref:LPXTG-motif cell wall anchor domain-containing protein n=1 Tax=Salegentibacter salegens TaxID=143223 RepID=A0A1M7M984_9FLAO|nr:LPXTG cell wall anchor domain-containing protein [Salegentibacter salegens]PRX51541.1 LPXTG-motif cell wall-anchored protein [Salegentibacter salegens]SHM86838.1 LPXTG-motif cell wall anchor domain-containing protein [Salegentibacter salegens]